MIDRLTTLTLNLLKSNVSIVLIFYASGFLSFIAYYRVLGIPYIAGSSQVYAELAGRNIIIILQTFIFLLTQPDYLFSIVNDLSWAGNAIYIWLVAVVVLVIIRVIFKCYSQKSFIIRLQQKPFTLPIQLLLITITVVTTFHIETQSFYAKNVLQATSSFSNFYQQKQNIINYEKQTNKIYYEKRIKTSKQLNSIKNGKSSFILNSSNGTDDFIKNFFFSIPENYDESGNDDKRLNALMLIVLIVSITAIILAIYRQHTQITPFLF